MGVLSPPTPFSKVLSGQCLKQMAPGGLQYQGLHEVVCLIASVVTDIVKTVRDMQIKGDAMP